MKLNRQLKFSTTAFLAVVLSTTVGSSIEILDTHYLTSASGGMTVASRLDLAQIFTIENAGWLSAVEVNVRNEEANAPLILEIRTLAGGRPSEGNALPDVLSSFSISQAGIGETFSYVRFDIPDITVTAGEQLALVLRSASTRDYVWQGDLNWTPFGYPPGTYPGGQGFNRGTAAARAPGDSTPGSEWGNIYLFNSPSVPAGGGALADFGFKTYVTEANSIPDAGGTLTLLGTALIGLGMIARKYAV